MKCKSCGAPTWTFIAIEEDEFEPICELCYYALKEAQDDTSLGSTMDD